MTFIPIEGKKNYTISFHILDKIKRKDQNNNIKCFFNI